MGVLESWTLIPFCSGLDFETMDLYFFSLRGGLAAALLNSKSFEFPRESLILTLQQAT